MLEGELKIEDKKKKILERFQDIVENNCQNNENTGDYSLKEYKEKDQCFTYFIFSLLLENL